MASRVNINWTIRGGWRILKSEAGGCRRALSAGRNTPQLKTIRKLKDENLANMREPQDKGSKQGPQPEVLTGAEIIWRCLERLGVDCVFGYPGGAILPTYDALTKSSVHHVLVRHEQGATHMAD